MQRRYCYVSGIRLGVPALEELCARGRPPALVISYTAEYADSSGFNHFEDLARAHDLPHVRACDINSEEVRQSLTAHAIDLMVVAGWSQQVHEQALADLSLGGSDCTHPCRWDAGMHPFLDDPQGDERQRRHPPSPCGRGRCGRYRRPDLVRSSRRRHRHRPVRTHLPPAERTARTAHRRPSAAPHLAAPERTRLGVAPATAQRRAPGPDGLGDGRGPDVRALADPYPVLLRCSAVPASPCAREN